MDVSKREYEVLCLIAHEFTAPEIADKLCISTHTVKSHKKNICLKFGVRNGAGMIRKAFEKGILKTTPSYIVETV